ncbi:subclass B3 metallo-beta-lactamase [Altericroceibacterium xinjiangense]|uniref:subclass B3 metallo-beta-lactamase n=1 Tax=Altericroceibacterium xinjiangense TaxID=762261 RepID=UPI000F7DB464|nr:subclass B3 metallo-beta-lactamase [Altericroceibacterium xinjiangense]
MSASLDRAAWALVLLSGFPAAPAQSQTPPPSAPADQAHWTDRCADWDEWDKPGPPFRIHGNSYYVGTCGIAAVLITGDSLADAGHVLIDGGTAKDADLIARNVEALGLRMSDVKLLLHSHEHFDHVGGLAELQRRSGARLLASPKAAPVLTSGIAAPDDPQFGTLDSFPPARVDGEVKDGEVVRLGDLALMATTTPGHSPGALSWQWKSCAGGDCRTIVYADSLSPISNDAYRFGDHPAYLAAYRVGLDKVAQFDCQILLTPHPTASGMRERLLKGSLDDPAACRAYADGIRKRLDDRLAEEARG